MSPIDRDKRHGDMSTSELIALLDQLDPSGNSTVEVFYTDSGGDNVRTKPVSCVVVQGDSVVLS